MHEWTLKQRALAYRFADVLLPEYVTECDPWEWHADAWRRLFTVREWRVGGFQVAVAGEQTHRGDVTLWMYLGGDDDLSSPQRRQLAQFLLDADELLQHLQ